MRRTVNAIRCIGVVHMRSIYVQPDAAAQLPRVAQAVGVSGLLAELIRAAVKVPLPYALDHINLWAIDDGLGWAVVDTGARTEEADTAMTIVKLDDSSTSVITDEKTMLGENLNGVGQTFEARTYA